MVNEQKKATVKEIENKLSSTEGFVVTDYRGLTVQQLIELRRKLREQEVEYKIYKNRLVKVAVKNLNMEEMEFMLTGPTAIAFCKQNPAEATKILAGFAKKAGQPKLKGGWLEGRVFDSKAMFAIANLPSREELLSRVVGNMKAPISSLVNVLSASIRNLAVVLRAIADQQK
jgi:large subunit ribosomal protein L10